MARLEWEKANRRDRRRRLTGDQRMAKKNAKRQQAIADFVTQHDLACFKCGTTRGEWAKSGISQRGPWVICVHCVDPKQATK